MNSEFSLWGIASQDVARFYETNPLFRLKRRSKPIRTANMIVPFNHELKETRFLNRAAPISLIILVAATISYHFFDISLATYFKMIPPQLESVVQFLTDLIAPWPLSCIWPTLYFFFFFFRQRKSLANRFLSIAISVLMANFCVEILKRLFGRARPELLWLQHLYGFEFFKTHNLQFSFPSGHACTIGAIMGALACFYPKHSYLFLAVAFLLALTRVVLNFHYLSDILVGMTIGLFISQWVYRTMKIGNVRFKPTL